MEAVTASLRGKAAAQQIDPVESFVFRGRPSSFIASLFPHADDYYLRMKGLLRVIHKICCEALEIEDPSYFAAIYGDENHVDALRIAHYPPDLDPAPDRNPVVAAKDSGQGTSKIVVEDLDDVEKREADKDIGHKALPQCPPRLRYGAHTDYLDITILKPDYSDWCPLPQPLEPTPSQTAAGAGAGAGASADCHMSTGGLQILRRGCDPADESNWFPVKIHHDAAQAAPAPASAPTPALEQEVPLVVNIGDLWNIWTANRWQSPVHRVTREISVAVAGAGAVDTGQQAAEPSPSSPVLRDASRTQKRRARQSLVFFGLPMESALVKPLKGAKIEDFAAEKSPAEADEGLGLGGQGACTATSGVNNPFHPSRFTPILAGQHLQEKVSRSNA
jgi:hypothetical protein